MISSIHCTPEQWLVVLCRCCWDSKQTGSKERIPKVSEVLLSGESTLPWRWSRSYLQHLQQPFQHFEDHQGSYWMATILELLSWNMSLFLEAINLMPLIRRPQVQVWSFSDNPYQNQRKYSTDERKWHAPLSHLRSIHWVWISIIHLTQILLILIQTSSLGSKYFTHLMRLGFVFDYS